MFKFRKAKRSFTFSRSASFFSPHVFATPNAPLLESRRVQRRPVWNAVRAGSGAAALTPFCTLRSAPGCRVASLTWLLQEQVESCCFHGYCLTLGCCDEVGREKNKKGREQAKEP